MAWALVIAVGATGVALLIGPAVERCRPMMCRSGPGARRDGDDEKGPSPDEGPALGRLVRLTGLARALALRPADLLILGREPGALRSERAMMSITAGVGPAIAIGMVTVLSGHTPGPMPILAWLLAAPPATLVMFNTHLRHRAEERRDRFRRELGLHMELTAIALAGGAGPTQAMVEAAERSDGPYFHRVRLALAAAEVRRRSPYEALWDLGRSLGLAELVEIGSSLAMADRNGAPIRSALVNKADGIGFRLMNAREREAEARSVVMSLPSVLMLAGFLLFLLYPFLVTLAETT